VLELRPVGLDVPGAVRVTLLANAISAVQGHAPRLFLTRSHIDAVDLGMLVAKHEKIIVPDQWSNDGDVPALHPGHILLVDCADTLTCKTALEIVRRRAAEQALRTRSLVGST
jgi:hypothetical protein